jgi:hydroxyacylglutathione hydrolase
MPDYLQVWPAHGSGSACGKALGAVPQSTVGYEKRTNRVLGLAHDREAFIADILDGQPEPPGYFARMKMWNRDGVPLLGEIPAPKVCSPAEVDSEMRVVDVRPWKEFREGHLPGSIWSRLGNGLLMSVGSYIQPEERIAIVADEAVHDRVIRNLIRIGLDRIECTLLPASLVAGETAPEVSAEEFKAIIEQDPSIHVLDVRRQGEWKDGHVDGSTNIAHTRLIDRIEEVPTGGPIYVHCAGGTRSAMAASELRRRGYDAINIAGGYSGMRRLGLERLTDKCAC